MYIAVLAAAPLLLDYFATPPAQRSLRRTVAVGLGLLAVCVAWIGPTAIDWENLPACSEVQPGQPCSNGGFIVRR